MKMLIILAVKIRFEVVNIIIRIRSKRVVISKYGGVFKPLKIQLFSCDIVSRHPQKNNELMDSLSISISFMVEKGNLVATQ